MKTLRITLTKPGAQASCLLSYRITDYPESSAWSGNRNAFELAPGIPADPGGSLENLPRVVAHQAALAGATYTLTDLGGEAATWTDEIIP